MKINKYAKLKIFFVFLFIMLMPFNISLAREIPNHNSNYYVDEMNVLSEETKNLINNQEIRNGGQVFVLTVDNLEEDPYDFAVKAFKEYRLGDKDLDNGLLISLSRNPSGKRSIRVITGYGVEGILPDGKIGRIIDNYMMPYFREDDLDTGIAEGFKVFVDEINKEEFILEDDKEEKVVYGINSDESYDSYDELPFTSSSLFLKFLFTLVGGALGIAFIGENIEKFKQRKKEEEKKRIKNLSYDEIIDLYKNNTPDEYFYLYEDRMHYLLKNKTLDELREEEKVFDRLGYFKDVYEKTIRKKEKERIFKLSDEDLKKEIAYAKSDLKPLYQSEIDDRARRYISALSDTEIEREIFNSSSEYNRFARDEYIRRKYLKFDNFDIIDILKIRELINNSKYDNITSNFHKIADELESLLNKKLYNRIKNLSDYEIEEHIGSRLYREYPSYINSLKKELDEREIQRRLEEERRKQEEEEEEERRRTATSYTSSSSSWESSLWDDDDDSWGSFGSSFGGFSGGGGSTGGGGAGRDF
jgi:hypothetical protein